MAGWAGDFIHIVEVIGEQEVTELDIATVIGMVTVMVLMQATELDIEPGRGIQIVTFIIIVQVV